MISPLRALPLLAVVTATLLLPATVRAQQQPPEPLPSARLPIPDVDENAAPIAFLEAARGAIAAGNIGEAQEALERAESRALDRSVRPSRAGIPDSQPLVQKIGAARQALQAGDRMRALQSVEAALATATQNQD
ncbi:conserved exported protein of unknown function [Rhodovastum atsumiense]|uniref:DUF4398 domain-containing protein n=1 Tax=Rhodovastum atsumiense TaxID=504468 RepID=A0A5M6IUT1_9PROT|nr:hypothetical protein [Rhodovastum atsumiense]KAA5611709.1 hypothetical protein F1189_13000 [Rhodovastum atsumiense]CAH2604286.1 conserved exported protein of unknown function [Rhodovastum atsumiense]